MIFEIFDQSDDKEAWPDPPKSPQLTKITQLNQLNKQIMTFFISYRGFSFSAMPSEKWLSGKVDS